ncbi:major facilitator superfamily domain-containing protein [Mycena vulgaris]|nr:major facilitator superfamily domain-containing protein [Mycena vulgaris]
MDGIPDERTALVAKSILYRTPLPKRQLAILMLVQMCEPLASQSIYPYINQLVSELDITAGDEKKVGYYSYHSTFFITEAMTVILWSRASDRLGHKTILLIGLFGTFLSMLLFGLSRQFGTLVASRCLTGLLNGNVGVINSAIADMTDHSNRAEAFAYISVIWEAGAALGPLVGGLLARPQDRFPHLFSGTFWDDFPYFLPCGVIGGFVLLTCSLVLPGFKEVSLHFRSIKIPVRTNALPPTRRPPIHIRELITFPVIISIANYAALELLYISFNVLLTLFLAMPIAVGGLGLPPATIGLIMSMYSAATALFQVLFCAKLIQRFGAARAFIVGISMCLPIFALLPLISIIVQRTGLTPVVWILVGCVLGLGALMATSFGVIFMFLSASVPTSSRGTVNGIAQTAVSSAKAIGPAMATSLFSLSVEQNLLGGYAVYALLLALSSLALLLATSLPAEVWEEVDE